MGELRDSMRVVSPFNGSQSHTGRIRSFLNNSDYREIASVPLILNYGELYDTDVKCK